MKISLRIASILLMACMATGAFALHVAAQELNDPTLKIDAISIENLPEVNLFVKGEKLGRLLEDVELVVREDGVEQDLLARNSIEKGLQIALVVDPSLNVASVGNSGDTYQFEIANGATSLIQSGILSVRTDFLNAFAISDEAQTFSALTEEWQRDHQAVVNRLYQYASSTPIEPVSLTESLDDVLAAMQNTPVDVDLLQTVVLFADGLAPLSSSDTSDVIQKAQTQDLAIHVVLLGDINSEGRRNLLDIAQATGGVITTYENASSLEAIWRRLDEETQIEELIYRLSQADPEQVSVTASSENGVELVATRNFPEVALEPVEIEALLESPTGTIERTGETSESSIEALEPGILPITVNFAWPDGVEREISEVIYTIDDDVVSVQDVGPFDSFELPISALDEGLYSIEVVATDEYGLSSQAESIPINIVVNYLQSAVDFGESTNATGTLSNASVGSDETVPSTLVQEDTGNQGMNILGLQLPETIDIFGVTFLVNGITLLIALFPIIFLLALFLYWLTQRNDQPAEPDYGYYEYDNNGYFYRFEPSAEDNMQMTQPQVSVIEPEEELTMPVKLPSFYTNAAAYLIYVSGGEHLPKKMAIETSEPVRIGRKKSFCDQILDDQRVSRLHAVITYEDGNFYVKDEGSSGGTFVNRRKLGPTDKQLLKHNDIVNFNEVEYRMEVSEPDSTADAENGVETIQEAGNPESVIS